MQETLRALLILQERERRVLQLQRELAALPSEEARARAKLKSDEEALARAKSELQAAELEVKRIELDAETRRTTIRRLRQQQGETRKNEEYTALGNEVVRYEREVDQLETRELEAMEIIDSKRQQLAIVQAAHNKTLAIVNEDIAALGKRRSNLEERLKEAQSEAAARREHVPEELLPLFDRLMKSKDGTAVVMLRDDRCTGCQIRVIAATMIAVQRASELVRCDNCGRILAGIE